MLFFNGIVEKNFNNTPLMIAIENNDVEICKHLLMDISVNVNCKDIFKKTSIFK